ncbi:hypothetical protein, conserved [Eimeria maxima]|uniref:YEATS domain-containing protein n=1 Tax=Eimeria maxima TaxID=5804 RepID=U6MEQ3_EIMMA|nr:hypothetical protein, conserved [Eimeria maxima]CDJ60135.1 hypothetical protein, conserved [Eimeria maxima]
MPPYEVSEAGWGEFDISAKIFLIDESLPPVEMSHFLKLNLAGAPQGPCIASETYDELLIHEPAEWFYDNLTAVPIGEAAPHPLSPYFLKPQENEEKQLQLYMGLQAYVQTETISLMQDAFLLSLRIQELQRQHEALTTGKATGAAAASGATAAAAAAGAGAAGTSAPGTAATSNEEAAGAAGTAPGAPGLARSACLPAGGDAFAAAAKRQISSGFAAPISNTPSLTGVGPRGPNMPAAAAAYGPPPKSPMLPAAAATAAHHDPQPAQPHQQNNAPMPAQPHMAQPMHAQQQQHVLQQQQHQQVQHQQFLQQQQMLQQQQRQMMQQQQPTPYLHKQAHPAASPQQQQQQQPQQQPAVVQQQAMGQMPVGPGPMQSPLEQGVWTCSPLWSRPFEPFTKETDAILYS